MMTTFRLIVLRLYNKTLGRISWFSYLLRRWLVYLLVKTAKERYTASSKFFDWRELEE